MTVEVTRFPSGLVVVTDDMPHLETASLGVWVNCGSRYESSDEHGISHFLEHMAFKGTERRSARQIAEQIEAVGGDLNAATGVEVTAYYARMLKADVPLALDVLADILSHPRFDPDEIVREKNVIIQEIGALEDTPDDLVFDFLQATAFANQPVGRSILGTPETVRSVDARKLRAYLARNYRAPSTVVAAAGAVEHAAIVDEVERLFTQFTGPAPAGPESATFKGASISSGAISSKCISRLRSKACRNATRRSIAFRSSPIFWAAACPHGYFRRCARSEVSAIRSTHSTRPIPTPGCSVSMRVPTPPMRRNSCASSSARWRRPPWG